MAPLTLEEISDRFEIDDLLTRYATAVDQRDWALYESCFTEDAFIDYTSAGGIKGTRADVRAWLEKTMEMFPMSQHLAGNRDIRIDGDTATARSVFYNPMALAPGSKEPRLFFEGGYYNDELVRTPDGWKIRQRVEESSYSTMRQKRLEPA